MNPTDDHPDTDPAVELESIVARVLERLPTDGERAISEACAEAPELIEPVRERILLLQSLGLAERPTMDRLGPYRVLRILGEGGMGQVLLGEQTEPVHRLVAIKSIRGGVSTREILARFDLERQALAVLEHPGIARVYEAGEDQEHRPYFVMEFVDGPSITRWADEARYTVHQRIELFLQVTDAVQHAHARGVIHRDLKPSNILVRELDGNAVAKVIDFGLAKTRSPGTTNESLRTEAGQLLGTPETMSPEQAAGDPSAVDVRSDVYSLGVVLYELLTGRLPFPSERLRSVPIGDMLRILREEPAPTASSCFAESDDEGVRILSRSRASDPNALKAHLRGDLDWILERALAKEARDRYATVREFELDLVRHLDGRVVSAAPERFSYRAAKFVRRHRQAVAIACLFVLVAIVGAVGITTQYVRASENLGRFDRLADLDEAIALETEWTTDLWPLHPDNLPALGEWSQRLGQLTKRSRDLAKDISAVRDAVDSGDESDADRRRNERLLAALLSLEPRLVQLNALADRPAQRAASIRSIGRRSIEEQEVRWAACLERIANSGRYPSLSRETKDGRVEAALAPQFGLVPLGPDPASGLEEFALLTSTDGVVAERDDQGRLGRPRNEWEPVLVLVPRSTEWMGSQDVRSDGPVYDTSSQGDEFPPTRFELPAFLIGKHEITQSQWFRVLGEDPSVNSTRDSRSGGWDEFGGAHPVETISWVQSRRFAHRFGCELPTEAQWERAARAGTETAYWWGEDGVNHLHEFANGGDRTLYETDPEFWSELKDTESDSYAIHAPIGSFPANPWGLHDTHGNVWEWCLDGNLPMATAPETKRTDTSYRLRKQPIRPDGLRVAPEEDPYQRMVRGGSFKSEAIRLRSSTRLMGAPNATRSAFGMRLARSIVLRSP